MVQKAVFFPPGYLLTPDCAVCVAVGITLAVVGFLGVVWEHGSRASVTFFAVTCTISIWILGQAACFATISPETALWWCRDFTFLGVAFLPTAVLFFVLETSGAYRARGILRWVCLGLSLLFYAAASRTPWLIPTVRRFFWGYQPKFSLASLPYLFFLGVVMSYCAFLAGRRLRRTTSASERRRGRLIMIGLGVPCLGAVDFMSAFGAPVYPAGYVAVAALAVIALVVLRRYRITAVAPQSLGEEVARTMTDGIVTLDVHGRVRITNEPAARIFGRSVKEMAGESALSIPGMHELYGRLPQILAQGSATFEVLVEVEERRTVSFSASVIHDEDHNPAEVVFIARDLTQHMRDEAALREANVRLVASLKENDILFKEIHHRVKNNLQVISSLLFLQENRTEDPRYRAIIGDCRNQILSIAQVHEDLYRSKDFRNVRFNEYIRSLISRLLSTFQGKGCTKFKLELALEDIPLSIDKAIPCALILNELCLNAFKYAFPTGSTEREPVLRIELSGGQGSVRLSVVDNGIGFPEDFDPGKSGSLGMQIIGTLTRQLGGSLHLESKQGARVTVEFPRQETVHGD